jgi:hypothetical protein
MMHALGLGLGFRECMGMRELRVSGRVYVWEMSGEVWSGRGVEEGEGEWE